MQSEIDKKYVSMLFKFSLQLRNSKNAATAFVAAFFELEIWSNI